MRKPVPTRAPSGILLAASIMIFGGCTAPPEVAVHYLGHSAFILDFGDGTTVLTDFGESNAYGLDSPISDLGGFVPSITTISHQHADHAGGHLPEGIPTILRGEEIFQDGDLTITPIPTFERSLTISDNFSFLFEYRGLKILHLGDCQSMMLGFSKAMLGPEGWFYTQEQLGALIEETYPDTYDLVLMPIGFTQDIIPEAAEFAGHLKAKAIIPMHYWTPEDRDSFLNRMAGRRDGADRPYAARFLDESDFLLTPREEPVDTVAVVGMVPGSPS